MEEQRLRSKLVMAMEDALLHQVMRLDPKHQMTDLQLRTAQLIFAQMVHQLWIELVW
jgi:hypothetical protein